MFRQNFSEESEKVLNAQIQKELHAHYAYLQLATYFKRHDVALPGFAKFFQQSSKEELEHAQKLIDYVVLRGGNVCFFDIKGSFEALTENLTPEKSLRMALTMELDVYEHLLKVHASAVNDPQLCDFIESEFLIEQVHAHKDLADKLTQLKRVGDGLGIYMFDRELQNI